MTVLQELASLYQRRAAQAGWPRAGFSTGTVGAEMALRRDGSVIGLISLLSPDAKGKMQPRVIELPSAPPDRRGLKLVPGRFWDPMPYGLGVAMGKDGPSLTADRANLKFRVFRDAHLTLLEGETDEALATFATFLRSWQPAAALDFPDIARLAGQNVIFSVDGVALYDLPAAQRYLASSGEGAEILCLVTGRHGPITRLHPDIKGVYGDDGRSLRKLVSFNNDAETSHGKSQGDNAPTSEAAAFAYGTALNALLAKGSGNSLRIGDATVVFWAHGDAPEAEAEAEDALAAAFATSTAGQTDERDEGRLRAHLTEVAQGRVPEGTALDPATRVFVLGLAPNAARLSVRFWYPGALGDLARHVVDFWDECAIEPSPFWKGGALALPKPRSLLYDLASPAELARWKRKDDGEGSRDKRAKRLDLIGGDLMRAILTGHRYPATALSAVIGRLRSEGEPKMKIASGKTSDAAPRWDRQLDGRRAALIRAVLIRNFDLEVNVALDEDATDTAYLLGRLFGAYAYAEKSYQERGAGLRAKYMGAASATPARVFPMLMRGYEHNLDALRKAGGMKAGAGVKADRAVAAVLGRLPGGETLPGALPLEEQGRFFIGFYHQISAFYAKAEDAAEALIETQDEGDDE